MSAKTYLAIVRDKGINKTGYLRDVYPGERRATPYERILGELATREGATLIPGNPQAQGSGDGTLGKTPRTDGRETFSLTPMVIVALAAEAPPQTFCTLPARPFAIPPGAPSPWPDPGHRPTAQYAGQC